MNKIDPNKDYALISPAQYVSRENILDDCGKFILRWGKKALVSGGTRAMKAIENKLFPALDRSGIKWDKLMFSGECCEESISTIIKEAKRVNADVIIGVGGGKSLDSAKAAAEGCGVPVVCIPTIAATCAASSALSVIYTSGGVHQRDYYLEKNPNLVLVDPTVIANAPIEYFESGILDSLSKWYEGRAAFKRIKDPDVSTFSAIRLSLLLNEIMEKEAESAVKAVKNNEVTPSVITVIDLNIYLAAVIQGFGKRTRGAAAHCIHSGLSVLEESHSIPHGFKVGYGIIVQLFIEEYSINEIGRAVNFFRLMDLEPTFKGMKLPFTPQILKALAEKSLLGDTMKYMPIEVTADKVITAMEKAEKEVAKL